MHYITWYIFNILLSLAMGSTSLFFTPQASIMEDPVTGSSHCSLIPYWSNVLKKQEMTAIQLSKRRGKLYCVNNKDRVLIKGKAKTYFICK